MTDTESDPFSPYFEPIEGPRTEDARALYAFWRGLAEPPALPPREAITMEALAELGCLAHCFILEPINGGDDWRYRLLGTAIVAMYGQEVTNVPFRDHMTSEEAENAIALSNQVANSRKPLFLKARFISGEHSRMVETMSLPILSSDDETVWLFGGTFFIEL